jgi:phosphate starvation-inducible protein PhoH
MTKTQVVLFDSYSEGKNIVAYGSAGTGKTFCVLYNALREVLDEKSPYEKIYIIRSIVSTRDVGFLPGMLEEKIEMYEMPYKYMAIFWIKTLFDFFLFRSWGRGFGDSKRLKSTKNYGM